MIYGAPCLGSHHWRVPFLFCCFRPEPAPSQQLACQSIHTSLHMSMYSTAVTHSEVAVLQCRTRCTMCDRECHSKSADQVSCGAH